MSFVLTIRFNPDNDACVSITPDPETAAQKMRLAAVLQGVADQMMCEVHGSWEAEDFECAGTA